MKKLLITMTIFTICSILPVSAASIGPKTEYYGNRSLTYGLATKRNAGTHHYSEFAFSRTGGGMKMYVHNVALTTGNNAEYHYQSATQNKNISVGFTTGSPEARHFYQELFNSSR